MRRVLTAALFSTTLTLPAGAPVAARSSVGDARITAAVDAYLRPLIAIDAFQGVVLVARGDRILVQKGYGLANVELGVPNTPERVFRIASLSKPFTEVALGRLMEEHRLSLDDSLARFLPGFPNGGRITLDLLRTHRAGIVSRNSIPYDEEANAPNTLDSLVRWIAAQPLDFEPGAKERYSNGGYAVLARVIERASAMSYADYLGHAVLEPLGLTHTRHEADQMLIPGRAYGYQPSPSERHALRLAPFQQMATKTGGGSLVSTAGDLRRFLRAFDHDNVIHRSTWERLFGRDSIQSFQGRCPGFNVFMLRDFAHDVDVVVLANNYASGMVGTVGTDLLALAVGRAAEPPRWRADEPTDSSIARRWAGRFHTVGGRLPYGEGPFELRWERGGVVFCIGDEPLDVLLPQGNGAYLLRNLWSELRLPDATGGGRPTLRPLWLKRDPVPLERLAAAGP